MDMILGGEHVVREESSQRGRREGVRRNQRRIAGGGIDAGCNGGRSVVDMVLGGEHEGKGQFRVFIWHRKTNAQAALLSRTVYSEP